jgi:site-specific recombinase XerD
VDEWRLFWVGRGRIADGGGESGPGRWEDLERRERDLGFRDGQPILVSPEGRVDARLSVFFSRSRFAVLSRGTQETYAPDYRLFFSFLWRRGLRWNHSTADDLADWEDWRRRSPENPRTIGGARWARELAALKLLYDWAVAAGHVSASPVATHQVRASGGEMVEVADLSPTDVKRYDVKWLTPAAFRKWRNVGLGGMLPSGLENDAFRGRNDGRDTAFADLMYSSGLRRREAGTLLVAEIPELGTRNYYAARVGGAVAKRAGRSFYVSHAALQSVHGYRLATRAAVVRRAQRRGTYEQLADALVLEHVGRRGEVRYRDQQGAVVSSSLDRMDHRVRARLLVRTPEGLEPATLWLTEVGLPLGYRSWLRIFQRASDRCRVHGLGVYVTPHMLRHSMALRMLIALNNAYDRRFGLTPEDKRRYTEIYDGVWGMVRDLLGHRSEQVTREVYLEPVRGLQLETLLGDEDNPVDEQMLSEVARKTGLVLDVA